MELRPKLPMMSLAENFIFEVDPVLSAKKILDALEYRTWKLGIHKRTAEKNETSLAQGW